MDLTEAPPVDVRPVLVRERADLCDLLRSLDAAAWQTPTAAPGWTVKDVALHLLDDDLGWLSRGRDRDSSGRLEIGSDHDAFVDALAAKNQRWIDGAAGLSPRVITDLLAWSGTQMDAYYAEMDLAADGYVLWASDGPVPVWFDIAQDLTERWVHQMQIREALDRVGDYQADYVVPVLDTLMWALPHQVRLPRPVGTSARIRVRDAKEWTLRTTPEGRWALHENGAATDAAPAVTLTMSQRFAWKWLTGAEQEWTDLDLVGDEDLGRAILATRGIIV